MAATDSILCLFLCEYGDDLTPFSFSFSPLWTDNLLIDYQFTFSLIQEDDNHYTAINFMASPEQVNILYCTCVPAFSLTDDDNEFVDKIPKQYFGNFFAFSMCLFL